jgi:hypothetical protein
MDGPNSSQDVTSPCDMKSGNGCSAFLNYTLLAFLVRQLFFSLSFRLSPSTSLTFPSRHYSVAFGKCLQLDSDQVI